MSDDDQRYKRDAGKRKWSLMPARALRMVLDTAATLGSKKYAARSWRQVDGGLERYWESIGRHYHDLDEAIQERGFDAILENSSDGIPHLMQLAFDALIVIDLALIAEDERGKP